MSADSRGRPQARFLDFYTGDRKFDYKGPEFGSYKSLLFGNYLPAMSSLIRTNELREAGDWAKGNILEDWEIWLKLSKKYKFAFVDEAVALYRWHPFNTQKIAPEKFGSSCFKLIEGERGFCISNNLLTEWRQSHESALERFFFNREISPIKRLAHLKPSDLPTITLVAMKLTIRKLARTFSGHEQQMMTNLVVRKSLFQPLFRLPKLFADLGGPAGKIGAVARRLRSRFGPP